MAAGLQKKNAILRNELRHLKRQVGGDGSVQEQQRNHEGPLGGNDCQKKDGNGMHRAGIGRSAAAVAALATPTVVGLGSFVGAFLPVTTELSNETPPRGPGHFLRALYETFISTIMRRIPHLFESALTMPHSQSPRGSLCSARHPQISMHIHGERSSGYLD